MHEPEEQEERVQREEREERQEAAKWLDAFTGRAMSSVRRDVAQHTCSTGTQLNPLAVSFVPGAAFFGQEGGS
eukprot:74833-Alexandrium_andersonii.AAC.1